MNDKNNLAKLIVSGDTSNHEMAAIMLKNYTAVEFLEMLQEVGSLYINTMPPNIKKAQGEFFLAPNLRIMFNIQSNRSFDFHFFNDKHPLAPPRAANYIGFTIEGSELKHYGYGTVAAEHFLGYLQQYYKNSQ